MTTVYFVLDRAVHFGACLLFFSIFAFDRLVAAPAFISGQTAAIDWWHKWQRLLSRILLITILLTGIFWFILVALTMSGLPFGQACQFAVLKTVWSQTTFGLATQWRLLFWLLAAVMAALTERTTYPRRRYFIWTELLLAAALLGSLAWAGHGQEDSAWHLAADILHLLVAGFWPTSLLSLLLFLSHWRFTANGRLVISLPILVQRFSAFSLGSVALLTLTGFINARYLVGTWANLVGQPYGRWLIMKILLFIAAVAIGAVNLLRLKPRLNADNPHAPQVQTSAKQLQFNVQLELWIGVVITLIVAVLGILSPVPE